MIANDLLTLERAVEYCKGQSKFNPLTAEDRAYDEGVAACVRMLEDMMPHPSVACPGCHGSGYVATGFGKPNVPCPECHQRGNG